MQLSFQLVLGLLVLVLAVNSQENEFGLVVNLYPKGLIFRRIGSPLRISCGASANRNDLEMSLYKDKKRIQNVVSQLKEGEDRDQPGRINLVHEVARIDEFDIAKYTCRAYVNDKTHYEDVTLTVDLADYDDDCGGAGCDNRCINDTTTTRRTTTRIIIPTAAPIGYCFDYETYDEQLRCEPTQKLCKGRGGTEVKCIEKAWVCDGENDCADGSDEENCPTRGSQRVCRPTQFLCKNGNQCINKAYVCDRNRDCEDNSDEEGCVKPMVKSPPVRSLDICVGETIVLRCGAGGFPTPYINWRLNWGHICPTARCCVENEDGYGVLTIKNAVKSDSGAYSCESINNQGREIHPVDAIVTVRDCFETEAPVVQCYQYGTRAQVGNQCYCNAGYGGAYCRDCVAGYDRDQYGRCIARSAPSIQCYLYGTRSQSSSECFCLEGYVGLTCRDCASGYSRDVYGRCIRRSVTSNCDVFGTSYATPSECVCRVGYTSFYCDKCAEGYEKDSNDRECVPVVVAPVASKKN